MLKTNEIKNLFLRFEEAAVEYKSIECWSARELQPLFDYSQWREYFRPFCQHRQNGQNRRRLNTEKGKALKSK